MLDLVGIKEHTVLIKRNFYIETRLMIETIQTV
jgi:hypothetical protein